MRQKGAVHLLTPGRGVVRWESGDNKFSKEIDVGGPDDGETDGIQCEQQGQHEGENVGCIFSFSFSGSTLSISSVR